MPLLLGSLAGICFYAALHHLQVSLHLERRAGHLALVVTGVALGIYALLNLLSYSPTTPEEIQLRFKLAVAAAIVGVGGLFWYAALRSRMERRWVLLVTAVLALALLANLLSTGGLILGEVTGVEEVVLPWGDVHRRPVGETSPLEGWILIPASLLVLFVLGRHLVRLWLRGERQESALLTGVVVLPVLPSLLEVVLSAPGEVPVPASEASMVAAFVFVSLLTSRDVARTAAMEEDVAHSDEIFRRLVETAPEAIGILDAMRRQFVAVNHRAEELLGMSSQEILTMRPEEFYSQASAGTDRDALRDRAQAMLRKALAGETPVTRWPVRRSDGAVVPCELRLALLREPGADLLVRVSLLDLSDLEAGRRRREAMEEKLEEAQGLERLGTLAGSIAHDFNNLLMPILGYGEMALELLDGHLARSHVEAMVHAAERARVLNQQILAFSRDRAERIELHRIQPLVEESLGFLRATLPAQIALESRLDAPDFTARIDGAELQEILMSLGTNAVEAMGSGGTLGIELQADDDEVELLVSDTGAGMDPEVRARAFEPFFTTKGAASASGLGLSMVHGLVTGWGGAVELDSTPGEGTTVRLRLPSAHG